MFHLIRPNVSLLPQILTTEGDNILEETLQEHKRPLETRFKEGLERYRIKEEDVANGISCAICLDGFQFEDTVIRLPCNGNISHFFHTGDSECEGILPWFEMHNTCPVCRTEFPAEPEPEPEPEIPESLIGTTNTNLTPGQIAGLSINTSFFPSMSTTQLPISQIEVETDIQHDINELLRVIIEERENNNNNDNNNDNNEAVENNNEAVENNNEEVENNNEEVENNENTPLQRFILPYINNLIREESERIEEEDIQEAILRSMDER